MKLWMMAVVTAITAGSPQVARAGWLYQPDGQDQAGMYASWKTLDQSWDKLSMSERATVQPEYSYHALFTPNDPQFVQQWNFQAVNATSAWDNDQTAPLYGGDPAVLVAVLDTGLAYETYASYVPSNEIANRVWSNPNDPLDGIDNDHNGFVDDLHGWDFVNLDNHPNDDHGHGTHIAGTIADQTDNGIGVAGLAWQSTILPLKVLDAGGNGTTSTITAAINYAVQAGADVINLSLGGNNDDPILHQAIQAASSRGIVVIAAAGNDGAAELNYPARYSEVLAVGAIRSGSSLASYSNTGTNLDLVAPGGAVDPDPWQGIVQESCRAVNDCSGMALVSYTGTSQAAAHVAGAAALLLACGAPGGAIASTLTGSATDLGVTGNDTQYGAGLLNIAGAMRQAGCGVPIPPTPNVITAVASATTTQTVGARLPVPYTHPIFHWSGQAGAVYQVTWGKQGGDTTTSAQTGTSFSPNLTSQGLYQLTVRTVDALSRTSEAQTFLYRFRRTTLVLSHQGSTSQVSLFSNTGTAVRSWSAGLGDVTPLVAGAYTSHQALRLLVSGVNAGTAVRVMNTLGVREALWRPFGPGLVGGVRATGLRRIGQENLVATTGSTRGATVRWMTLAGGRVRSVKAFPNHDRGLTVTNADLDGDGNDEVIVAKIKGSLLAAFTIDGQRLWQVQPFGTSWRGTWSLTRLDTNNDGRDEIAVGGLRSDGSTKIVLINAAGKSSGTWTLRSSNGTGAVDLAAADLNGNGTEELLSITQQGTGVVDVWSPVGKRSAVMTLNRAVHEYHLTVLP